MEILKPSFQQARVNGLLVQMESGGFVVEAEAEVDGYSRGTILSCKGRCSALCRTTEKPNGAKKAITAMSHGSILFVIFDGSCRKL